MTPEQTTTTRPAPRAPAGGTAIPIAAARLALAIRFHLDVPGETPEARYFAATGRYPCDD